MSEPMDRSFKLLLALPGSVKHERSTALSSAPLGRTRLSSQVRRLASTLPNGEARGGAYVVHYRLRKPRQAGGWGSRGSLQGAGRGAV